MSNQDKPEQNARVGLKIKLDEATAQGTYSNLVMVQHSEGEFVLDFAFLQPGRQEGKVNSRVIISPRHAKRLMAALGENVTRYEQRFGAIAVPTRTEGGGSGSGQIH